MFDEECTLSSFDQLHHTMPGVLPHLSYDVQLATPNQRVLLRMSCVDYPTELLRQTMRVRFQRYVYRTFLSNALASELRRGTGASKFCPLPIHGTLRFRAIADITKLDCYAQLRFPLGKVQAGLLSVLTLCAPHPRR